MDTGSIADWFSGIASTAAVIVALLGYWLVDRHRKQDESERQRQTANQIGICIMVTSNLNNAVYKHVWPELRGETVPEGWFLSQRVSPMIGLEKEHLGNLNREQLTLLSDLKEFDLLRSIMSVHQSYRTIVTSMDHYRERYDAYHAALPTPVRMEGTVGTHEMSADDYRRVLPMRAILDELLRQMREMTEENDRICNDLIDSFHVKMKPHFKGQKIVVLGRDKPSSS